MLVATGLGRRISIKPLIFFRKICRNLVEKIDQLLTLKRDENHNLPLACTPLSSNGALAPS